MSDYDVVMDYILTRLTVHHNGQVAYRSHYEEWLRVQGIVFPAPSVLRP